MKRRVEFGEWEDWCERVWQWEVPLLQPRKPRNQRHTRPEISQLSLPGFDVKVNGSTVYFDKLQARILIDEDEYDESTDENIYIIRMAPDSKFGSNLVQNEVRDRLVHYINGSYYIELQAKDNCPYCRHKLAAAVYEDNSEREFGVLLEHCPNCTYWVWHYFVYAHISRPPSTAIAYTSFMGKLREFDEKFPEGCAEEIAAWIRRNPKRWHTIQPTRFEQVITDIFRANYTSADVTHVGKPDDGGVDIVYVDADKEKWLIQVKRREKADSSESVSTIRNLLGTLVLEDASRGIVVSTADHFSYQAYAAAHRASERGMTIRLIDRFALDRMLDGVIVDKPWLSPLQQSFPEFVRFLEASVLHKERSNPIDELSKAALAGHLVSFDPRPKQWQIRRFMQKRNRSHK
ncbi:MAG: hypothetical protein OHK0046_17260 [Anaerolineae bacterium]